MWVKIFAVSVLFSPNSKICQNFRKNQNFLNSHFQNLPKPLSWAPNIGIFSNRVRRLGKVRDFLLCNDSYQSNSIWINYLQFWPDCSLLELHPPSKFTWSYWLSFGKLAFYTPAHWILFSIHAAHSALTFVEWGALRRF